MEKTKIIGIYSKVSNVSNEKDTTSTPLELKKIEIEVIGILPVYKTKMVFRSLKDILKQIKKFFMEEKQEIVKEGSPDYEEKEKVIYDYYFDEVNGEPKFIKNS